MCYTVLQENYTYLLLCADGSLYCGWTNDLEARVAAHNRGAGAKYTKSRRPVRLVYYETFPTKQEAMRREWEIKHLRRSEKLALINHRFSNAGASFSWKYHREDVIGV